MANTYKKVYIHLVWVVRNREALLEKEWRYKLFSYIAGCLNKRGHYSLAVNGWVDYVHILFDYNCKELISDLVAELKKASSKFIKEENFSKFHFEWQVGYGLFSGGWKEKDQMIKYVLNQEKHHSEKLTLRKEYMNLLRDYEIEFKNEYLFTFFD